MHSVLRLALKLGTCLCSYAYLAHLNFSLLCAHPRRLSLRQRYLCAQPDVLPLTRAAKAEGAGVEVSVEANGASVKPDVPSKALDPAPAPEPEAPVELVDPAEVRDPCAFTPLARALRICKQACGGPLPLPIPAGTQSLSTSALLGSRF